MKIVTITLILCAIVCTACENKHSDYDAGIEAYKRGHYETALYDFEKRANQGDSFAQFCLGYMYKYGEGVKADNEKAIAWYTKAAQKGYAPAQNNLAKMYGDRWRNSEDDEVSDFEKSLELWKQAAEKNDPVAQFNLGFVYLAVVYADESLNLEKDEGLLILEKAEEWLKRAAKQKQPKLIYTRASGLLGILYMKKGREAADNEDFNSANKWYEMAESSYKAAAEKGNKEAQNDLASMYYNGAGVAQSLTEDKRWQKALDWYKKAAEQKFAASQQSLAFMYYLGQGVAPDPKKAVELWKEAADPENQGNAAAQNSLAAMYSKGEGIEPNPEMASRWFHLAAQQGETMAQFNIGKNFEIGENGVSQDDTEAYYWYGLALRDPNYPDRGQIYDHPDKTIVKDIVTDTTERRENVGKKLSDKHRNEIQERVDNWKPKESSYRFGTGFYINEHYILTNQHVVTWEDKDNKDKKPKYHEYNEFRIPYRRVELCDWDEDVDLALLYDKRGNTDTATFRSHPVDVGNLIVSFGYPKSHVLSYEGNSTSGQVSGRSGMLNEPYPRNYFQHTAPIQGGNSGGPVLDLMGNVVGVTRYMMKFTVQGGRTITISPPQNVNFAIKFDVIQRFLEKNGIIVNPVTKDKNTENSDKINLQKIYEEIYAKARKFTVPVLSFKNKDEKTFETDLDTIDYKIY